MKNHIRRNFREFVKNCYLRIVDKPIPPVSFFEERLILKLRDDVMNIGSSICTPTWEQMNSELRELIIHSDPRCFMRWPPVLLALGGSNSIGIFREFRSLKKSPFWNQYKLAITELPFGRPIPFIINNYTSGHLIHNAYHLLQLQFCFGVDYKKLNLIVEFGGGYGSMCRLIHNLGFRGKYIIYDLPEFSALQSFYLRAVGQDVRELSDMEMDKNGIYIVKSIDDFMFIISRCDITETSLFIATWSLSEAPLQMRGKFLALVDSFKYYLLAYQESFEDIDNYKYFENYFKGRYDFKTWPIKQLPGSHYLIACRST